MLTVPWSQTRMHPPDEMVGELGHTWVDWSVPSIVTLAVACVPVGCVLTATTTFLEKAPNHCTFSCTMRHWKLYAPGEGGAVTVKLNVPCAPGATLPGMKTRFRPQVVLS